MKLNKLIKVSREHAEKMFNVVLEKHNQDQKKFLRKLARKEKNNVKYN